MTTGDILIKFWQFTYKLRFHYLELLWITLDRYLSPFSPPHPLKVLLNSEGTGGLRGGRRRVLIGGKGSNFRQGE
jgi:hypothetical protein